jgi:hypothetical protein
MYKGVIAAVAAMWISVPASAFSFQSCTNGCLLDPVLDKNMLTNYTVSPFTGLTYRWELILSNPEATLTLAGPNQVEVDFFRRGADGLEYISGGRNDFAWRFDVDVKPGLTTIIASSAQDFYFCNQPGPIGEICSAGHRVWGNSVRAQLSSPDNNPVTVTFRSTALAPVPEPASWAMLLAGFGLVGSATRQNGRKRSVGRFAAARA